MFTNSVLAVTGALLSVVAAVPMAEQHHHQHHHKRDYVWVTHTEEEIVTVPVTKTVWIEPGETPPTEPHGYSAPSSADVEPAATTAASAPAYTPPSSPAESSSSPAPVYEAPSSTSVYVAPTPSSTSVYVAPTPSSTSVYVAPTPSSTSVYVAPVPTTPTSTYVPPPATTYVAPTTSAAPAYSAPAASSGSGSSSSGGSGLSSGMAKAGTSYSGDLTWYQVGLGACGENSVSSDPIVAVSEAIFDSYDNGNPNNNPLCGKYVSITGADGSQFKGKIVDRCPGCAEADLDLSEDFFNSVTNNGDGRVHNMKWEFM